MRWGWVWVARVISSPLIGLPACTQLCYTPTRTDCPPLNLDLHAVHLEGRTADASRYPPTHTIINPDRVPTRTPMPDCL